MKNIILTIFIIISQNFLFSQDYNLRDTTINCDLEYSFIYFHSGYNMKNQKKKKLIRNYENQIANNEKGYDLMIYKFLKQNNRINSPYVIISTRNNHGKINFYDEILYIDSSNYQKLKCYKYEDLKKQKQKIEITCKVKYSFDNVYLFEEFLEIKKVDDNTYSEEEDPEFKVLNYE
ncbi:MAG: hypothetical protein HYR91_04835 [Flavobacteriia bacterium]|nr:hypothetical protein [Flavobacteriia bacterium]